MVATLVIHGITWITIHLPTPEDGRLSRPSCLTHSGRLTDEVVTRQPWIRCSSGKVRQLQTDVLTTEPCRNLFTYLLIYYEHTTLATEQGNFLLLRAIQMTLLTN